MSEHGFGDGRAWLLWTSVEADGRGRSGEPRAGGVSRLRPYIVTSGHASPVDDSVEVEAQVQTTEAGIDSQGGVAFECGDILRLCCTTMSVAEVAARLDLHVGVARVLVSELAAIGYLTIWRPSPELADDVGLIERVIRGLEGIC